MRHIRLISAGVALLLLTGIEPLHAEADAPPQTDSGPPPDHCRDMFARISAEIAYLGPQLGLDQVQQPLWKRWQQKVLAAASAEQSRCQSGEAQMGARPTAIQREDMFVVMASGHIEAVKAERPDLQALYGALSNGQRAVFDRYWPPLPPGGPPSKRP